MNDQEKNELFERLLTKPPRQRESLIKQLNLGEEDRAELESLASIAGNIWISAHGAPPLEEDRTAALLGLVPNDAVGLDGKELKIARKKARLNIGELASQLERRGWQVSTQEVFAWERGNTASVSPALIDAISQVVRTSVDQLISKPSQDYENLTLLQRLRSHPDFEGLVRQWAKIKNLSFPTAEIMLGSRAANTVHRGNKPNLEQDIALLKELISLVGNQNEDDV